MKAIEFVTMAKPGQAIDIPQEYAAEVSGEIRVILLINVQDKSKNTRKKTFEALKVETKGFKFNRDDAYDE